MIADAQHAGQQAAQLELRGQWLANATAEQERTAELEERASGSRQRTRGRAAGPGHEHRCPGAVLGVVRQRGVAELVQGRAAGGLGE